MNPFDRSDASGLPEATEELAAVASTSRLDALETLVSGMAPESSPKALRRIAFFDPDRALRLLARGDGLFPLDDSRFTIGVLEGLPPHCDPEIIRFLMRTAHKADDNSYLTTLGTERYFAPVARFLRRRTSMISTAIVPS